MVRSKKELQIMKDFKITTTNGLNLQSGDFELISQKERIIQHVKTALYTFKNEWILDKKRGIDYPSGLKNTNFLEYEIRTQILQVEGVVSISDYSQSFDKSTLFVKIDATLITEYGEVKISEQIGKDYNV